MYSGVRNSSALAPAICARKRFTASTSLPSASWLYKGKVSMAISSKLKPSGAMRAMACASLRLNDSSRKLPTMTATWYWLMNTPYDKTKKGFLLWKP
ncbi:hypothetical protein D3C85_1495760 [compost metagenome]